MQQQGQIMYRSIRHLLLHLNSHQVWGQRYCCLKGFVHAVLQRAVGCQCCFLCLGCSCCCTCLCLGMCLLWCILRSTSEHSVSVRGLQPGRLKVVGISQSAEETAGCWQIRPDRLAVADLLLPVHCLLSSGRQPCPLSAVLHSLHRSM